MGLYFVRHGQTAWNDIGRFQGSTDVPLNLLGIEQAEKTALALKDIHFDAIYSSPLNRAQVTAQTIARPHQLTVQVEPRIAEINFGQWEGMTFEEIERKWPGRIKEMYIHQISSKWGIDLSAISNQGKMEKRFDFVVKTPGMIYGVETNFYGSGGSKLNETARSYKTLALETDTIEGLTFVWFTDGKGWTSARHNLEETFDVMQHIYSINDMENGIINEVFI